MSRAGLSTDGYAGRGEFRGAKVGPPLHITRGVSSVTNNAADCSSFVEVQLGDDMRAPFTPHRTSGAFLRRITSMI